MLDRIPEEILIEILLKLPPKSLINPVSVCKAWQSLIRSPFFESLYFSKTEKQFLVQAYNIRDQCSLIAKGEEPLSIKSIDFPFNVPIGTDCRIMGSCNGLLCLCIQSIDYSNRPPTHLNVIIWNPCTGNHVFLPQSIRSEVNQKVVEQVLLGIGVASNVYKVVRIVYTITLKPNYGDVGPRAEIFTLGTGTMWRKLSFAYRVRPAHEYSWFFNGFVHWIVYKAKNENVCRSSILTFDVVNEVFGEIKLSEELKLNLQHVGTLAIIRESFGLIDFKWKKGFDVWIMKDYGVTESWTKLYRIDGNGMKSIVGFLESSELLIRMDDFQFVIYNEKTKESKHLKVFGNFGKNRYSWYVDEFKESLVLLGGSI